MRRPHKLKFADVEEIKQRLDSLGLITRSSQIVAWKNTTASHLPNTIAGECVERLANVWLGERYNSFNLATLNMDLTIILRAVGLLRYLGNMQFVILPYAVDEAGNVADPYQLLAEVLLP